MERYATGEHEVFAPLYRLMAPRLYRFCLRLAALKSEADDLFQETFLRLHRARATYMRGANAVHWAFAIARAIHLDRLRYRRRRPEHLGEVGDVGQSERLHADERYSPEATARAHDLVEIVTFELARMSERNRTAYVLLREEGLRVKEVAALLGTTADVVKQRAHRASERLRNALGAAGWKECDADGSAWSAIAAPFRDASPEAG
jgi:RNA polymerase sigma-70 factor, ECF subfamily